MLPGGGFTTAQLVGMALLTQYFLEKEICYVAQASFKLLAILLPHFLSSGNDWCMPLYPAGTTFSTTIHLGYFHLTCSDVTWSGGLLLHHLCEQVRCALLTPYPALLLIFLYTARVSRPSSQARPGTFAPTGLST